MLAVISPAKTLDLNTPVPPVAVTQPTFLQQAEPLAHAAARLSKARLTKLMHISDKLAQLTAERFAAFEVPFTADNARPAIYTFAGDVYTGFEVKTLDEAAVDFAQDHVRILSGLYGLLRPLDLMQPYRLEMGTSWAPGRKKDLYAWWGKSLADALVADLSDDPEPVIVNLASQEYWKAVDRKALGNRRVIDIAFKEQRGGKLVFNSFGAKKARGMMARFICEHRLQKAEALKGFDTDGYAFSADGSTENHWLFVRNVAAAD
ncbi:hypothetical protein BSL82_02015 [Tardibacter chloracetimidivorans]|uniref:UPF0246 protein BSL82_02015 n=1 Tax=Tardibacter chloracetimidivorans TaxID=1921510 RepID=A0A1L3ZRH3_9SPHN|nr:peroxide stress protein YaaA [Tardibacter chloracetimidivorans]API58228.1 hypothetical protein BSL82_02015 [Tardibacter chloracetimidivorans]